MFRRRLGITILELLIALVIVGIMTAATSRAFVVGINTSNSLIASREATLDRIDFEDRLAEILRRAWLAPTTTTTTSYFIGQVGPIQSTVTSGSSTPTGAANSSASSSSGGSAASTDNPLTNSGNSDNLVFTTVGDQIPTQFIQSQDDWETLNQDFGPEGGVAEVSFSTTAIGDPGGHTGLFLRIQRPSDDDASQGGFEQVLNRNVASIGFEFYDGTQWDPTWDSQTMTTPQLPAGVRVTYRFEKDAVDHVFIVWLRGSNVTAANPVTQ